MTFERGARLGPGGRRRSPTRHRVWEPGHRARLPRRHLRLAGRRGGPSGQRRDARPVLRRRGRRPARPRLLDRPARRAGRPRGAAHPARRAAAAAMHFGDPRRRRTRRHDPDAADAHGRRQPPRPGPLRTGRRVQRRRPLEPPRVRAAEIPAANGITNAASLARMYAATRSARSTASGCSPSETMTRAIEVRRSTGPTPCSSSTSRSASASCATRPFAKFGSPHRLRPLRRRWLGGLRRPRARHRLRLRHEQDGPGHRRRPPHRRAAQASTAVY